MGLSREMKSLKQGLAAFLAVTLLMPAQPIMAANRLLTNTITEETTEGISRKGSSNNAEKQLKDEVKFNTGNKVYSVVSREDFENEFGDASFEEDGSYTINIPEENPFFPYEVQFTYNGKTSKEWFMTPDDTVTVGGHIFHVSSLFDGTVMTQMDFKVGEDVIVVYPEEKKFTDGDGADEQTLLPQTQRRLTIDLKPYTPVELTMLTFNSIFTGNNA